MTEHRSVALLGASGSTGRTVLQVAPTRDIEVVAAVWDRHRLPDVDRSVTDVEAPLSDADALATAFDGVAAVISTLGVARRTPDDRPARHLPGVLGAMGRAGVNRYIGISGAGLTLDGERTPLPRRVMSWVVRRAAPAVHADKVAEYRTLRTGDVAWTLARASRLVDGPPTGRWAVGADRPPAFTLTRGDMADVLLRQIDDDTYVRQAPMIATSG